jgi:hypothetical protein
MALQDIANLAIDPQFFARVSAQMSTVALTIIAEGADEVQSLSISGAPTGGTFLLGNLPGFSSTRTGTLAATPTVTALSTTSGLAVGMSVSGAGIPAGATIATITSATALTLSIAATISGSSSLTFNGTPAVVVPWNCTAAQLQTILSTNVASIGSGNVVCTGGPLPGTAITITFIGTLGGQPLNLMTISANSLTPSGTPAVARTTAGSAVYNDESRTMLASSVIKGQVNIQPYVLSVASDSTVQSQYLSVGPPMNQINVQDAAIVAAVQNQWNAWSYQ